MVCAYGAIVTVLLRGVIETLLDSIKWVAAEAEWLANCLLREAEIVEYRRAAARADQALGQDGANVDQGKGLGPCRR